MNKVTRLRIQIRFERFLDSEVYFAICVVGLVIGLYCFLNLFQY